MNTLEHEASKQMEAAQRIREFLASLGDDDDAQLLQDTIEGETDLFEIMDKIIGALDEDQLLIDGIKERQSELSERKSRLERRIELRRGLIETAMQIAELKTLQRPLATLSMTQRGPALQVTDETLIPARFWKVGKPILDKAALKEELGGGAPIPGAELTNGCASLTLRRK